ncbi:MAG TPA: lysylphosphatidylglycerol synthase domain-containing protein [Jatrophihabitans sp.]|nr:lysylphosphatidylglycerol synthase domain-containing protein [Jatrophihabitans sp.]
MRRITSSRWLRLGFAILAVALLIYAIVDQWHNVAPHFSQLSLAGVTLSSIAVLAGMYAMLRTWQVTLAGLGSPLDLVRAGRIFYLGQLGKYVPGSVWPIVVQMELGADAGVPRSSSVMTLLFIYLLYSTSAAFVSAICLPWVTDTVPIWLAVLALLVGVALLLPPVLNRLIALGMRVLRQPNPPRMRPRAVLGSFGWAVAMWVCFGAHILLLAHDLGHPLDGRLLLLAVGGYTLAWICGFLFIVAPAGGGVRELVLTALFAATLGHDSAFALALVSRLMMTVADLVCAFAAAASLGPAKLRELRTRGERPAERPSPDRSRA